jgi:hypothetical protein
MHIHEPPNPPDAPCTFISCIHTILAHTLHGIMESELLYKLPVNVLHCISVQTVLMYRLIRVVMLSHDFHHIPLYVCI